MSLDLYVYGRKSSEKAKKFYEIYKKCDEAGIETPKEIEAFFDGEAPKPQGQRIEIDKVLKKVEGGYVVDLERLRKEFPDVTSIEAILD